MGFLYYGSAEHPIEIDDLTLAHLKVVIATKLRRSESFTLSWRHDDEQPRGRSTIWLNSAIPLRFEFQGPDPPELDPQRIIAYANSANTSGGILIPDEHILGFPTRGTSAP
ncbi:hypothetical protein [Microbacterium panaciterrae]|uniref:DUF7882 domain-containing protein n=1 Tax=Microbacterium panaciterrae TaxID=985759 RepID=A0ABP8PBL2_9MICO